MPRRSPHCAASWPRSVHRCSSLELPEARTAGRDIFCLYNRCCCLPAPHGSAGARRVSHWGGRSGTQVKMKRVILITGPVGSGRASALRRLAGSGHAVIDAEELAHQVMRPGQPGHAQILQHFGHCGSHPEWGNRPVEAEPGGSRESAGQRGHPFDHRSAGAGGAASSGSRTRPPPSSSSRSTTQTPTAPGKPPMQSGCSRPRLSSGSRISSTSTVGSGAWLNRWFDPARIVHWGIHCATLCCEAAARHPGFGSKSRLPCTVWAGNSPPRLRTRTPRQQSSQQRQNAPGRRRVIARAQREAALARGRRALPPG